MIRRFWHWLEDKRELTHVGGLLRIGPTATLALGIYHICELEQVFVIVTACGDESGTHEESPVMMLAGYVSTLCKWDHFDLKWKWHVSCAGLPGYFHATEHWKTAEGATFAPHMVRLLERYAILGYVVELDKESYEHYVGGSRPRKPQLDTRYSICFRFLLALLVTKLPLLLERSDITLIFILESGAAGSADAQRIVSERQKQPETQDLAQILGPVPLAFRDKKKVPGLQAADGLSFASLKLVPTNPEMVDLLQDGSLTQWTNVTQLKPPIAHLRLDGTVLGALKSDIRKMVELRRLIAIAARNGESFE